MDIASEMVHQQNKSGPKTKENLFLKFRPYIPWLGSPEVEKKRLFLAKES